MTTIEPAQFRQAASILEAWHRPLILTHESADGDAIGSVLAMRAILRGLGSAPLTVLFDRVPPPYLFLTEGDPLPIFGQGVSENDLSGVDGVAVLDTCAYGQLTPLADWLRATSLPIIAVDHHVTRDVPAQGLVYGNPARLHGYVCRCGRTLNELETRHWECEVCNESFTF